MALASLTDLKGYINKQDASDDVLLTRLLSSSSDWFERQTGVTFASASYTEVRNGNGQISIVPYHSPVIGVTSVTVDGQLVPERTSDVGWVLVDGVIWLDGYRFDIGIGNVTLVYSAGYDPIPGDVAQAVIELAALKFKERLSIGKSGESLAGQSVSFLPAIIPASVQGVVDAYRRIPCL